MHIKDVSINTYTLLHHYLSPTLVHVKSQQEKKSILAMEKSYYLANQEAKKYTDDSLTNAKGIHTDHYTKAMDFISELASKTKNLRIAGIAYLYIQAMKIDPVIDNHFDIFKPLFEERENKIEQVVAIHKSDEALDIRKTMAIAKYKTNEQMNQIMNPESFSAFANYLAQQGELPNLLNIDDPDKSKRPSGSDLRNDHG